MTEIFELEKWVWTEQDFDIMGWHDSHIYSIAFKPDSREFVMDIDYIFKWVHPVYPDNCFSFWVAPATLVFENAHTLYIEIDSYNCDAEIDSVQRSNPQKPINTDLIDKETEWTWVFDLQEGEISIKSVGYKQYIRRAPTFGTSQVLEPSMRGSDVFYRGRIE